MKKVLLTILDGFGEAPDGPGNAVKLANTPNIDALRKKYPFGLLEAHGEAVGLTKGAMGGSEVGHFTIGAGRVVPQFLLAINQSISDGSFFEKPELLDAFNHIKKTGKKMHLMGMLSNKGVHSHIDHLFALLDFAKKEGLEKVYIHITTDGRDVRERSAMQFIDQLQSKIKELGIGKIATIIGRYFSMDRDTNWDRTEKAYNLMTNGEGKKFNSPNEAIDYFYKNDSELTDYYIPQILLDEQGLVEEDDAIIFFNYRTDRTRQITSAFVDPNFSSFKKIKSPVKFVCMGPYSDIAPVVFDVPKVENNLGEWLSKNGKKQLRMAETEKFPHVTFFFNSQKKDPYLNEDRLLVNSPKVSSYDQKPEMSAPELTEKLLDAIQKSEHDLIVVNYANCDLVGHSGSINATIKAVEVVDDAVGKIYKQAMESGYSVILTADHGNADEMLYEDGSTKPSHSLYPVVCMVIDPEKKIENVKNGGLSDIAPTILELLDIEKSKEMTGDSLI